MGAAVGRETDAVALLRARWRRRRTRYDFYQTLRRLECLYADKPRWGEALRPIDEPVRLGQEPDSGVRAGAAGVVRASSPARETRPPAGAALRPVRAERTAAAAPDRVRARALRNAGDRDVLPVPRHLPSPLARAVLSRVGAGAAARQPRSPGRRSLRRLRRRAARRCSPATVRDRDTRAGRREAVPRRRARAPRAQRRRTARRSSSTSSACPSTSSSSSALDARSASASARRSARDGATLGAGAVLGQRVWDRQHKFRVHIGPLTLRRSTRAFLPGGSQSASRSSTGSRSTSSFELDWDVRLILKHDEVPRLTLDAHGGAWAGRRGSARAAPTRDARPTCACIP